MSIPSHMKWQYILQIYIFVFNFSQKLYICIYISLYICIFKFIQKASLISFRKLRTVASTGDWDPEARKREREFLFSPNLYCLKYFFFTTDYYCIIIKYSIFINICHLSPSFSAPHAGVQRHWIKRSSRWVVEADSLSFHMQHWLFQAVDFVYEM